MRNELEVSGEGDEGSPDTRGVPPAGYVAAGLVGLLAIGVVGWMIYRSRREKPLVRRLQDVLPDRVRELPAGVRARVSRVRSGRG
jgi:hypothetical protein